MDKAETSIVGAALEIIQRIGPCNAKIKVGNIEDVRISKRHFVIERAKELLKNMTESLPDSQELADEVAYSVRVMEIQQYGKDRVPAGPVIDESDEIIVVEGRADVLNLLKHGIKNSIAMNGTSCPETIKELSKKKIMTAFVDGDRGGDLIIKELSAITDLDYVTRAPDGKEVEEITKKEIHKALRARIAAEQAKLELGKNGKATDYRTPSTVKSTGYKREYTRPSVAPRYAPRVQKTPLSVDEKTKFKSMLEDLIGTRGAYILDKELSILGKVPVSELLTTIKSLNSRIYAVIFDGIIDKSLVDTAEKINVSHMVAMDSKVKPAETKVTILTSAEL